ncbi:MAG: hypothetical protein KKD44_29485 [Proteobacteria bacterium]|nr:hypothetical protein [Pseudomonadota bacterium]
MNKVIMGIPMWMIAAGVAAYFIIQKKRAATAIATSMPYPSSAWEMYTVQNGSGYVAPQNIMEPGYTPPVTQW